MRLFRRKKNKKQPTQIDHNALIGRKVRLTKFKKSSDQGHVFTGTITYIVPDPTKEHTYILSLDDDHDTLVWNALLNDPQSSNYEVLQVIE